MNSKSKQINFDEVHSTPLPQTLQPTVEPYDLLPEASHTPERPVSSQQMYQRNNIVSSSEEEIVDPNDLEQMAIIDQMLEEDIEKMTKALQDEKTSSHNERAVQCQIVDPNEFEQKMKEDNERYMEEVKEKVSQMEDEMNERYDSAVQEKEN